MAGTGGIRPGAGRPKGSKAMLSKNMAAEILSRCNADKILEGLLKSDNQKIQLETAKFLFDHVWGKASQPLSNPDGTPILQGITINFVRPS
jgi:hypothetical protein